MKVTVTQFWYVQQPPSKMNLQTKFGNARQDNVDDYNYGLNKLFPLKGSEVKDTVTKFWFMMHSLPKMHLQREFGNPMCANIGGMVWTSSF